MKTPTSISGSNQVPSDAELKADFIARVGVKVCDPAPAAILGESSPGWRRTAERRAIRSKDKSAKLAQQKRLAKRIAP